MTRALLFFSLPMLLGGLLALCRIGREARARQLSSSPLIKRDDPRCRLPDATNAAGLSWATVLWIFLGVAVLLWAARGELGW